MLIKLSRKVFSFSDGLSHYLVKTRFDVPRHCLSKAKQVLIPCPSEYGYFNGVKPL